MKKQIKETIQIHDFDQCSKQDLDDISKLVAALRTLMIITKREKNHAKISAILFHTLAIGNAFYVMKSTLNGQDKKFILLYIPLIIYCALGGFKGDNESRRAKQEFNELSEQYHTVKEILENVSPQHIHGIAEICRSEITKNDSATLQDVKKAAHYITLRYQR